MENQIKKIIIEYENGENKTIEKGVVMHTTTIDEDTENVAFDMCNISGREISSIVMSVMQLGEQLGMFKNYDQES